MFAQRVLTIDDESYSLPTGCAGHCATVFQMVDAVPAGVPMAFTLLRNSNRYVAYGSFLSRAS